MRAFATASSSLASGHILMETALTLAFWGVIFTFLPSISVCVPFFPLPRTRQRATGTLGEGGQEKGIRVVKCRDDRLNGDKGAYVLCYVPRHVPDHHVCVCGGSFATWDFHCVARGERNTR